MTLFNRFTKDARVAVQDATDVARELGATTVEAEHLLLAITRHDSPVASALHERGLDYDGLSAALVMETERSLAAVGVTADALTFSPYVESPKLATSAKQALELSLRISLERADRRIGTGHVVLGILRAKAGTVPRALAIAGVDQTELAERVSDVT